MKRQNILFAAAIAFFARAAFAAPSTPEPADFNTYQVVVNHVEGEHVSEMHNIELAARVGETTHLDSITYGSGVDGSLLPPVPVIREGIEMWLKPESLTRDGKMRVQVGVTVWVKGDVVSKVERRVDLGKGEALQLPEEAHYKVEVKREK